MRSLLVLLLGLVVVVLLASFMMTRSLPNPERQMSIGCEKQLLDISKAVAAANTCTTDADCAVYGQTCPPVTTCSTVLASQAVTNLTTILEEFQTSCGTISCTPCLEGASRAVCDDGKCYAEMGFTE